jgi:hypothetical protein
LVVAGVAVALAAEPDDIATLEEPIDDGLGEASSWSTVPQASGSLLDVTMTGRRAR